MTPLVMDSSSLILLAKCGLLEIVTVLYRVIVPSGVMAEAANEDLVKKHPDASAILELATKGALEVLEIEQTDPPLPLSLHRGEKEALLTALRLGNALLATDDGKAIKAARFLKVPFTVTPRIVVELFRLRKIPMKRARESLEKLATIGRYSPEIIADALLMLVEKQAEESNGEADNRQNT